jgi:hypothetical protein
MIADFSLPLLQAISDWQRGGDAKQSRRRGEALKESCKSLPEKFRTCPLRCFRQIALLKGGVWDLIGEDKLSEKISSWTTSIEVAKSFKNGVPPEGQGYQGVILCTSPNQNSVIVNFGELYDEPAFLAAMEQRRNSITGYHDGAGRYGNDQREVVLEIASVTQQEIYSMGGHSSPFDDLVDIAAKQIYGPEATLTQRTELLAQAEHARTEAGPRWLNCEATQRVLACMKPHAEKLSKIKRQQDENC